MEHTTAPIANLHKHAILDAVQAARKALRKGERFEAPEDTRTAATVAIATLDRVNTLVVGDQHDSLMALNLSEVVVALRDLAPTMQDGTEMRAAAERLHLASMLLFVARRERDLDARLRAILPDAYGISGMAEEAPADRAGDIIINANRIARLARA